MLHVEETEQMFYKRGKNGKVFLLVAKVADDFFIAETEGSTTDFIFALNKKFQLRSTNTGKTLTFLGSSITLDVHNDNSMYMKDYLSCIRPVNLSQSRTIELNALVSSGKTKECGALAGTSLFFGQKVLPQACPVASMVQQQLDHYVLLAKWTLFKAFEK